MNPHSTRRHAIRIQLLALVLVFGAFSCATSKVKKADPSPGSGKTSSGDPSLTGSPLPGLSKEASNVIVEEILTADAEFSLDQMELESTPELTELEKQDAAAAELARELALKSLAKRRKHSVQNIPIELNQKVGKWVRYFTETDRERFVRFLRNGEKYRPMIEAVLEEYRVPKNLYYLALIESGYQNHARSRANAVGMWQFGKATGKAYGLRANWTVDERKDPMRATRAAARHLRDLHKKFGSWYLSLAAYNAGMGRIRGAIRRGKTRDFWRLVRKRVLPRETRNYVPKFLAVLTIAHHLEKFGFAEPQAEPYPDLTAVKVPSPIRLKDVARVSGVPLSRLKAVNPHLRRGIVPRKRGGYSLWVQNKDLATFAKNKTKLARYRMKSEGRQVASRGRGYHRVKRGETLSQIARRYGLKVRTLKRINRMANDRIYAGTSLKVSMAAPKRNTVRRYRVRKGDNLSKLSKKFNLSIRELKRINGLRRNLIRVGQVLRVR